MPDLTAKRTAAYKPGLFGFCLFALVWATFLLFAGGLTTSIDAGMAFLDWPLSNGSINPEGWTVEADKRAEHSHRLLGMIIGNLSIVLVVWTQLREARTWVRRLAVILLLVVILQGLLGGARVLFDRLNTGSDDNVVAQVFAVLHACGAQVTLCLLVALAAATSRRWIERDGGLEHPAGRPARTWGVVLCILIFLQVLVGAIIRHTNVGMAIPTFPHANLDGGWIPAAWNGAVALNFTHRVGALLIVLALGVFLGYIWGTPHLRRALGPLTAAPIVLVSVQITLGALVVLKHLNDHAATAHHLAGAFLLASCWLLTFLSFRLPAPPGLAVAR